MKKRILYYDWDSLMQKDMLAALIEAGFEVIRTTERATHYLSDAAFEETLAKELKESGADFCFSFNFFPVISKVCEREQVRYVSWVFDSPLLNLYSESVTNSCNRIYHFDRAECERLRAIGVEHIYHLPLAAKCGKAVRTGDYKQDISFVGRLYDKKNFYDQIRRLPDAVRGFFEGMMEAQSHVWGYNFLEDCLAARPDVVQEFLRYVKLECPKECFYTDEMAIAGLFLAQKLTSMERIDAMAELSKVAKVALYSDSCPEGLAGNPNISYMGTVESEHAAPQVFADSKINLNLTLRCIRTGVPLRIFDIAAAGGFVLSNYQEELLECFEQGKEIAVYGSREEMRELAAYYLAHEEEREKMAQAAKLRVQNEHSFAKRIEVLFGE